jgi:hypothetical protein
MLGYNPDNCCSLLSRAEGNQVYPRREDFEPYEAEVDVDLWVIEVLQVVLS